MLMVVAADIARFNLFLLTTHLGLQKISLITATASVFVVLSIRLETEFIGLGV